MDYFTEILIQSGKSVILECNFNPKYYNEKFAKLEEKYDLNFIQILCYADKNVLLERFRSRANSIERHKGHMDSKRIDELKESILEGKIEKLNIKGPLIELDTTDFSKLNYEELLQKIKTLI